MIDSSKEPLSAEIKVYVLSPKFDWSHTFQSGDKYEVEGSPVKGMFVSLTMEKTAKGIAFKVNMLTEYCIDYLWEVVPTKKYFKDRVKGNE